jgi:DNA polymerase IV
VTRSATLPEPTDRTHDILTVALELLARLRLERARVRLLGVGVGNLGAGDRAHQLTLDDEAGDRDLPALLGDPRWERVERVADAVAARFAGMGVSYAALLDADDDPDDVAPRREDRHAGDDGGEDAPS